MRPLLHQIKAFFGSGRGASRSPEELEAAFRARYRCFRTLLTANNNALEAMAELEQALASGQTYGMAMVRAKATVVMVNVYKMVGSLIEMADGRYRELEKVFERISNDVNSLLERQPEEKEGPWIVPLAGVDRTVADQTGEKMASLGEAGNLPEVHIPPGFVMTAAAARYFLGANNLGPEINRLKQMLDPDDLQKLYETSAAIQSLIAGATLPGDLEEAMLAAYSVLERQTRPGIRVAMRSSALGEDLAGASFAGQYHTELYVDREFLGRTYKEIVASKYTSRAIIYRLKKGYRHEDIEMCVGCLAMIDAAVSGVTYSRPPTDPGGSWLVINCVSGAARKVVDGTVSTVRLAISRERPHRVLGCDGKERGDDVLPLFDGRLDAAKIEELARIAITLETHFAVPQDIEWSMDAQGLVHVLQSRPMSVAEDCEFDTILQDSPETDLLFSGQVTASPGVACGPIFVVRSAVDILRFPKGAVLVVEHPLPDWAPLLARAVALVAKTGSEAGHLATVSREFGIPALFGVPDEIRDLADGTTVTVDSRRRRIYAGSRSDLLAQASARPDLMEGSPVQTILKRVLRHIAPLNLTDPRSPYFKPSWCETLHDITRFCHEKSVTEMFDFGSRHHFNDRAARRLTSDVPLDWWVINLADGFREGGRIDAAFVHIDDVVSVPMQAIWDGMSAFVWEGPPRVDVKGMGSILFQSMMHPGLDPAAPSQMAAKNYFLVSKNFCNLSVRLGYHFAMIEAYLSDLLTESYVNFSFKGGAADDTRKAARIRLLSDILLRYDFRVELKGDALTARIEKRPTDFLQRQLKILGYLIVHARQIDMIMNNQGRADAYKDKFFREIDTMISK